MNKYLLIPLVLFIGLVLAIFVVMRRGRDPHELPSTLINKPAPDFQLQQLSEPTKTFTVKDMRGKVWLVNFWGSWCIACREEHPVLVKYSKAGEIPICGIDYTYGNDGRDERSAALEVLASEGNPYSQVIYDPDARTSIDYGVTGAPESFLIDKNGVIKFKQIGPITEDVWNNKIRPLAKQLNQ